MAISFHVPLVRTKASWLENVLEILLAQNMCWFRTKNLSTILVLPTFFKILL
jgi:hypothetical protein